VKILLISKVSLTNTSEGIFSLATSRTSCFNHSSPPDTRRLYHDILIQQFYFSSKRGQGFLTILKSIIVISFSEVVHLYIYHMPEIAEKN